MGTPAGAGEPPNVDAEGAEAAFEAGILTAAIPNVEAARPKQIKVKAPEG